jgi:hypothetical protein
MSHYIFSTTCFWRESFLRYYTSYVTYIKYLISIPKESRLRHKPRNSAAARPATLDFLFQKICITQRVYTVRTRINYKTVSATIFNKYLQYSTSENE